MEKYESAMFACTPALEYVADASMLGWSVGERKIYFSFVDPSGWPFEMVYNRTIRDGAGEVLAWEYTPRAHGHGDFAVIVFND